MTISLPLYRILFLYIQFLEDALAVLNFFCLIFENLGDLVLGRNKSTFVFPLSFPFHLASEFFFSPRSPPKTEVGAVLDTEEKGLASPACKSEKF